MPNWPDHVTGDAMVAVMDKVGIDGAIRFCLYGYDASYAVEVLQAHPCRLAIVNYQQTVEPFMRTDRLSDTERVTLTGDACAKPMAGHKGWPA